MVPSTGLNGADRSTDSAVDVLPPFLGCVLDHSLYWKGVSIGLHGRQVLTTASVAGFLMYCLLLARCPVTLTYGVGFTCMYLCLFRARAGLWHGGAGPPLILFGWIGGS